MNSAVRRTRNGKVATREVGVSAFIPYTHHVDDHTIATKDGYLLQILKIDGFAWETADQDQINQLAHERNTLLRGLGNSRFALYHHIIRREMSMSIYPDGQFSGFCRDLDDAWRAKLGQRRLFVNDQYLTVIRRPLRGNIGLIQEALRVLSAQTDRRAAEQSRKENLKALNDAVDSIVSSLHRYGARRIGVYETPDGLFSEALEMLAYLVNHEMRPIRLPRMALDRLLPTKRPFFGQETVELRGPVNGDSDLGALIAIKEYPPETGPGMTDSLLRLPHEMVITQSFALIDRGRAMESLIRTRRQMDVADEKATSLMDQLDDAQDDTASGRIVWGEHHLTAFVKAPSPRALDRAISDVMADLTTLGILAVREDANMEAAYWAQLPGNMAYIARNAPISSANFSGFAAMHNFPTGKLHGNHWGDAAALLETTSGTPYAFNFHHGDLGNFTVIGPSGTGKTVVLTFLMAQAQRFRPRSVFFDKDRGAEIFIRAVGGHYSVIRPGVSSGFNPLQLDDTPINRAFLREWLAQLVQPADRQPLTPTDRAVIRDAVDANYSEAPEHRRLSYLQEMFTGHERPGPDSLSARLGQWVGKGDRAWLFDHERDELSFEADTTGYDLTYILDDPLSRTPALMYMFHRVESLLDGTKTIIFIDEGWKALDDPWFAARIKDWEKTIRKQNGVLGFGSQSASDALATKVGPAIIEQSPTQIFMPNLKAGREDYCRGFGLTETEYELVRTLPDNSRCFLIKHGAHSVVVRLDLSGLDDILAVLSGRTETVALLDEIRADVGDRPDDWLPLFHQRRVHL